MIKPRTFLTTLRHCCLWLGTISVSMPVMAITWTNQQAADLVFGQASFTTNTSGTADNALNTPTGVIVDPTTGKVFITDYNNHRVLRFASLNTLTHGATAEAVLGTTGTAGCSQNTFQNPTSLTIDSSGHLWVSDHNNSRILRFDNAATIVSGANANAVLGQLNFTSCSDPGPVTQNLIGRPCGLATDSGGRLWADFCYSHRVLRFDNAASKANGANADGVLGQPDFTSSGSGLSATTMNLPTNITFDAAGNLYVVDANNNRVLRFNSAASKANGAAADLVLGQPNFTSNGAATTATGLSTSWSGGIAVDSSTGQVFVGDAQNHRILIYSNPTTNGVAASYVLGQPDFTSATANNGGLSASGLNSPRGIFFDAANNSLLVADVTNNRVLRYAPPEIQLLDGATDLPLNGTLNLGTTNVGSPIYKNLTIKDLGNGNLNLTGSPMVSVTGTGFSVIVNPAANIAPANPSVFYLQFNPSSVGLATGTVSIVNNDSNENPFTLSLQGTAVATVGSPVVVDRVDSDDTGSFAACTAAANDCSLRGAVAAVTSGGIINFDPSIAGQTITLSNTIALNKDLTIDGTGQKITISGNNAVRVFLVMSPAATTLRALTISNGNAGAANGGGGVFYSGGSTTGDVIDKCTLMGNQADYGGAIYTNGWVDKKITITNSTFVNNQATGPYGRGGAIRSDNAWGEITNTTIAYNQATSMGGGISIYYPPSLAIKNTIISLNTVNGNPDDVSYETYWLSVTNSLFTTDPKFGPLQNNGGDTQTMTLLTGSPALDTGDAASCQATDQRGVTRSLDGNNDGTVTCDMGAVEMESVPLPPSNFTATAISDTQINLAWQDNSFVETGYKIERNGTLIQTTAANAVTLSDTGLMCGTTYNYTVKATNALGDSTGVTASAITLPCPPKLLVTQGGSQILTGTSFSVGASGIGHHVHLSFTITNTGSNALVLLGTPKIQVSGTNAGEFSVDDTVTTSPIPGGSNTTFILNFMPNSVGSKTATLTIPNNESSYSFTVTGTAEAHQDLQITLVGEGQGTVTSDPTGMDCDPVLRVCTMPVIDSPRWVTLTPVPATGSEFTGWTGDAACQTNGQVLVITDTACTATFSLKSHQLTANFLGKGRVTGPGIDCPGQCTATYLYGTTVTLQAQVTRKMWNFSGWRGCDSQGQIQITNDVLCQAVFTPDPNIPGVGDGNGDGLKDAYQDNVVSLPDKVTGTYLTLETQPDTCIISDIYPDLAESQTIKLDHTKKFPQGMLYFDIACPQAQVSVYYHGMSKVSRNLKFYKFGPKVPGDLTTLAWYQLSNIKYEVVTIGGKPVVKGTYTLTDGELGDSTGVDGHIIDPIGLAGVE